MDLRTRSCPPVRDGKVSKTSDRRFGFFSGNATVSAAAAALGPFGFRGG